MFITMPRRLAVKAMIHVLHHALSEPSESGEFTVEGYRVKWHFEYKEKKNTLCVEIEDSLL